MIRSIELVNFMSYEHATIDFSPGVNVIRGRSDAGKSNITYAIQWALFGVLPAKVGKSDGLIRHGSTSCSVTIHLAGGVVSRTHGGTGKWLAVLNGAEYRGRDEVKRAMREYFGVSDLSRAWTSFVGITQFGVMDGFIDTKSVRKAYFDAVLGIDVYQRAWEKLAPITSDLKRRVDGARSVADASAVDVSAVESATFTLELLDAELATLRDKRSILQAQIDELLVASHKHDELSAKRTAAMDELLSVQSSIATLSRTVKDAKVLAGDIATAKNGIVKYEPDYELYMANADAKTKLPVAESQLAEVERSIAHDQSLLVSLDGMHRMVDDIQRDIASVMADMTSVRDEAAALRGTALDTINRSRASLALLADATACPVCGQPLSDEHRAREIESLNKTIEKARADLKQSDAVYAKSTDMASKIDDLRREEAAATKYASAAARNAEIEAHLNLLKERKQSLLSEVNALRQAVSDLERYEDGYNAYVNARLLIEDAVVPDIVALERELQDAHRQASDLELVIGEYDTQLANFDHARVSELSASLSSMNATIERTTAQRNEAALAHGSIANKYNRHQAALKELRELQLVYDRLMNIRNVIRRAAPIVGHNITAAVSSVANKLFSAVWERKGATMSWGDDYAINLNVDGREAGFATGGGMQVTAALATRFALAHVLGSNVDFIIADEVSMGAMDDEILSAIPSMLDIAAKDTQIITISHGGLFDQVAQNIIQVRYEDGRSLVS